MNIFRTKKNYPKCLWSRLVVAAVLQWMCELFNFDQYFCHRSMLEDMHYGNGWFSGKGESRAERREGMRLMGEVYKIWKQKECECNDDEPCN